MDSRRGKRNAAVHAPRGLLAKLLRRDRKLEFLPVAEPLGNGPLVVLSPLDLDKTANFTHGRPTSLWWWMGRTGLSKRSAWTAA